MASFLKQLRLLLWKNGLSVIRQPAWSVALIIWPIVIFIILAITRSQFPPQLKDTCYVAPRNLPSAGFFPFLQTLMCSTDSHCTNKSYLTQEQSKTVWYMGHRRRRDVQSHSLPSLLHDLPPLAHLQKEGLVHSILKRDTANQPELQDLWDRILNSSLESHPNVTSVMQALNNTVLVDQDSMNVVWDSISVLKKSICNFSMTAMNISDSSQVDPFTYGLINFCRSNNTVLEASLLTLNQVFLNNPEEVLHTVGESVVVVDRLQEETSVWDFLLGLPDLFLKPTDQEKLKTGAVELGSLKNVLSFIQMIFPEANVSASAMNAVIDKAIDFFNYTSSWQGRDTYIKLSDVLTQSSIDPLASEIKDLISQIQIPLEKIQVLLIDDDFNTFLCDKSITASYCRSWEVGQIFQAIHKGKVAQQVLVAWSQSSSSADIAFAKEMVSNILGLISPASSQALFKHVRSSRSTSNAQPQSLGEQIFLGIGNAAFDLLRGLPGWEYIQTFMMAGHSSMQMVRVAMEVQMPFLNTVLKDTKTLQEVLLSLAQNETVANAWADNVIDSIEQTLIKVFKGNTNCSDLYAPWAWMSAYTSVNPELWNTLVCSENYMWLEQMLMTSLNPVTEKVQQLAGIVNGSVMYNVTPSVIMSEWHTVSSTSMVYGTALQNLVTKLGQTNFTAWMSEQIPVHLSQILMTRGLEKFKTISPQLEQSCLWPSMEPYFHMAYWIMTYQPNVTTSPNCTLQSYALTCQTNFTWETFVPLIQSLIAEMSSNPASLLRPIQGTLALLQSVYHDRYMALLQQVLASNSSPLFSNDTLAISAKGLLLNLINTVDKEIRLLSNIESTEQFNTQLSHSLLNDIMASLGLGQLENILSDGLPISSLHPVVQNILQFLRNDSVLMLRNEGEFAVMSEILRQLGTVLPSQQQNQVEAVLNYTHALIRDLKICSAIGQDCVGDAQKVFELLNLTVSLLPDKPFNSLALNGNMTLSVVGDVLSLVLPWSMSVPAESTSEIVKKVQHLLHQIYASSNENLTSINDALQASNLTLSELEQVLNAIKIYNGSVFNNKLHLFLANMSIQSPQCLISQTIQTSQRPLYGEADCVLQFIQSAVGLLPVAEDVQTTLGHWLSITAAELKNFSSPETNALWVTEEVLTTTLSTIRQNLQSLHVDNVTVIKGELNILEDLLRISFRERYPYHTINSTLMVHGDYAQKVYGEITMWYLSKLGNATSGSTFAEILQPLIHMAKKHVDFINTETQLNTLVMNQIQNLSANVKLPLDGEDLTQVANAIMTILQGELGLIKTNLEIQQVFYDFVGSPMNVNIPDEIEAQIMTYLNLTKDWITNPQLTAALGRIFQWDISSLDIATPGMDLEHLIQAMTPLLCREEQTFLAVVEQVSQSVNYAIHLANSDGGLQSENFTNSIISAMSVVLESISNETGGLPQDVIHGILGAVHGSLQLILNPNMSNTQAGNITQETIKHVDEVIHALLPVEVTGVLVPITNSLLTYLQSISQPGGPDKWNQVILNVMTDLQNSVSSNSTAQPIISMLLNITESILSSDKDNMTGNWIANLQLTSIFNQTLVVPQGMVDTILVGYYGLLQLITKPNMSYTEANNLTMETIQKVNEVIQTLWPGETAEVLVPVTNSIFTILNSISKPVGSDNWNEVIINLMKELKNSLPSNNTAQSIISMFLKVTESILSSSERNFTSNQDIISFADNITSMMDQLIQSLLSPEEMAYITVSEQVLQHLNYALDVAISDGGLQNEKFSKSIVSAIGVVLERMSNETGRLPQDGIHNILGAFHGSLQLILNPNMSNAQAGNITQEIIKQVNEVLHALLPAEATEVLGPITNSILTYWQTISQPGGPDKWNEVIVNVMRELQNSLPSNGTAQFIISSVLKVTEHILSPQQGHANPWEYFGNFSLDNISKLTAQLTEFMSSVSPFLNESSHMVTQAVAVLVQIISGNAEELTFDKLEEMLAAFLSTFRETAVWESFPSVVSTMQTIIVNSTQNIQAQTAFFYTLQGPLYSILSDIFYGVNASGFNISYVVDGLPHALLLTTEAASQAGLEGNSLNCSYMLEIWKDVGNVAGISEDDVVLWCNVHLQPVTVAFSTPQLATTAYNMTEMDPLWANKTADMMVELLETFYRVALNYTFAGEHLMENLLYYTSTLSNLSVPELTNLANWNNQLYQTQLQQSMSAIQMALDQIGDEHPGMMPYINAIQETIHYTLQNGLLQNSTSDPEIIMQALEIALTGMNFTEEFIHYFRSGDMFMNPNVSTIDNIINDVIQLVVSMELLGDSPMLYGIMQQFVYLDNTSGILWKMIEFVNWMSFTEETGINFVIEGLPKLYEIVRQILPALTTVTSPRQCFADTFIDIAGNVLYLLRQIKQTSELFDPAKHYLNPLQMQLSQGQNLHELLSHTRNTRRHTGTREPVDDFLDLLDIDYQALLQILSIPLTTTEILETMHVFFANPDMAVILKGLSGAGHEETIDTSLNVLSYVTLPNNGEKLLEMFMDINNEGWNLENLHKIEKLAQSLGQTVDVAMGLSDQPSLNITQRIEHVAGQLQASVTNMVLNEGNVTSAVQFLSALNTILSENFEEVNDVSPQVAGSLLNILGPFSSPGSQMIVASYLTAVDQTAEAFSSLLSGDEAMYFNISREMLKAFALLEAYPKDENEVLHATNLISDSLNHLLNLLQITTIPTGQSVEEITHPLILSSALATQILFNLSMSNYSLSNNAEIEWQLTQIFNQMAADLPMESHVYLHAVKSALFSARSIVSNATEIIPNFPQISQEVTASLLSSLNITYDPMSEEMSPVDLAYILMTVSNQVSVTLFEGLTATDYPIQISQVVNSSSEALLTLYPIMPLDGQPYLNMTIHLMETMTSVVNDSNSVEDVDGAVSLIVNTINSLLAMVPQVNTNSTDDIMGNLEQTLKAVLMILQMDQNPLAQTADITQQLMHTIQNLYPQGNGSMEFDLAKLVLGDANISIDHLQMMNDTNWTNKVPLMLADLADTVPDDLQYATFIKTVMRSLANESQENLHLLQEVLNTVFEVGSASWMNESSGLILDRLLAQVCALEDMSSVKLISQTLSLDHKPLCTMAIPIIQAIRVLMLGAVNDSISISDVIFQTFVGNLSTYNTAVDWTSTLSQIVGFNISLLKSLRINMPAPAEVKVSELLENTTLFVEDVMRYTSFPPEYLKALLESPLPSSNLQILKFLADLKQCSNLSSLGLSPQGQAVFSAFCDLPVNDWYSMTLLLVRHVDMKSAIFRLIVSKEIQDLVGVMLEMINFLTEMMSKLAPALKKLQEYLTAIEELNLVANQEFHSLVRGKRSTISSRATLSTISRALCKNGILTLFAIGKLPIAADTDPSVQEVHRREQLIEKFKIPHNASPFCMNLYLDMVNTTGGAVAWAFLKPMLLGQVLYSPDTPLTREIIKKSNSTLNQFGDLKLYSAEWLKSSSYVMQSANVLAKTLPILQNSLRNPFVQNFIQTQTGIDVTQMSATLSQFSNMTDLLAQNKFIMDQITTLSNLMMNLSSCVNFDRYRGFNSSDELNTRAEKLAQNRELYASVIFKLPKEKSNSSLPHEIDYTIRMNIENSMRTDRARNPFWVKDAFISAIDTLRYSRGFVYLQESIERAIIEMQTGKAMDGPAVQIQAFPYPCYYKDEYLNSIAFAFPMALMISWVLFIANFVKKLVHERELRLHEYMKMMGVNPISHFFAWFIESAGFIVVTTIILTIILKAGGILPYSDGFVIFLYLCDYGLSILAISFLVSSFFDKTNIAGLSGSLIYIICFFPFIVLIHLEDNLSFSVKSALGLFSPTCFSYGSQYITRYEKQEEGIQWNNMYVSPLAGDTTSFGWLCWLLLIDSGLYFIIGIYIRMVFPGKYGISVPWYFPFTRSFWADMFSCCIRSPKKIGRGLLFTNMMQEHNNRDKSKGTNTFLANGEEDVSRLPVGVSLHSLTKTYGHRHAVDNLNLSFYEGHVTSLLGHNGAGKTTTMSLLTGLFAPTSGTIEVYGMDMQTYMEDVRKEMGVCMQYDVLFDHLTTKEHLLLYAQIKAPQWNMQEVNEQVRRILKETGMYAHRHKRVGTLSGGMKRKLSISIAFIGGSRLVVLDEPTTGVDPCSRRSIWDIVLQHKQERTIILSTHHLDEAEVLSDRIAFLERGGLKCCGSPFYLKDKLAKGYNLILTKKVQCPDSKEKFNSEELKQFIQSHLPDARPKEGDVGEVVYSLPPYSPQNAVAYQSLLNSLDQNLDSLQLGCYGISDTTLEEVFLQLTRDDMEPEVNSLPSVSESVLVNDLFASRDSIPDDINSMYLGEKASLNGSSSASGLALTAQRVMAMLLKRVHHSKRDWKGLISQVVLPVLFVIAAMGLGSIKSDLQHFPKMELTPALYHVDEQYAFFSNQNSSSSRLVDTMMSYPGIDHFCMKDPSNPVCLERHNKGAETWLSRGNNSATFSTCKCSKQMQSCPASGYDPPHIRNPSSQIVYNLTGINIENYLLSTANDFIRNRYGGWEFGKPLPIDLKMDMLDVPQNRTLSKVWYNPEGHHSMPAYLNSLNNYLLRSSLPPEKRQKYAISVSSHPYPGQVQGEDIMVGSLVSILVSLCVITGYSIMTASFVIYEVQEHHTGSKRLQQISGISEHFYWIINYFYDMALYMVPVVLSVVTVAAFQLSAFTDRQNLAAVTLLLVLFGFATFPWMYLLSAVFKDTEMAFIGYVCINLFISVNTIISTSIIYFLSQLNPNKQNVQDMYRTMSNVFLVFPQFSFGNGLMELARVDMQVQILNAYGVDAYKNPFSMDVLGWMFIALFLQGVICFTLRLLLNRSLIRKVRRLICRKKIVARSYSPNADEDVIAERLRVDSGAASADILQVNQLSKIYQHLKRSVHAVNGLSVGIPAGECFGLLGVNGAGKTTTFKMLTGDITPTDGSAKICDIDGRMVDIIDCRREGINIGYCPQVDALDDLLTGEEHLYFYARIRGISKREIDRVVNYLLQKMELNYHRHNTSESYSCGTRRKLSTALSLIGNPQILLLDEPSSGMDPRSKRHLWRIIQEQVMGKCAVVLTSHSMEECEALCTRLAIMVKGEFRCLGSLQHIKNRFGKGFTVKMYLAGASCDVDMISNFMQQNFPSVYLKDHHSNMVEYHVPVAPGGVASIFNQLESNKAVLQIQHFSVSQTTLDEVFINFAEGKMDADTQEMTEGSDVDSLDSYNALDT
ncbi:uncharacterized protein abca12 isoform X2 [Triplophysa rosa]|uniref:ATP-binding cassette sub-family A member 12 n=1 Tax=Triplophysa rosa TaxID=992332 RepID=A0A9W7WUI4_TRIRA|nr:uncharacterized protein abca12 isoform X2 [Triplophysa rosa]KAI7808566.1 putative ATP-binding cassette sub-family A member 12 [Triplophysa rosa]